MSLFEDVVALLFVAVSYLYVLSLVFVVSYCFRSASAESIRYRAATNMDERFDCHYDCCLTLLEATFERCHVAVRLDEAQC